MIVTIIIGSIILELVTCVKTISIYKKLGFRVMDNLFKDGYKIAANKITDEGNESYMDLRFSVSYLISLIPVINILYVKSLVKKCTKLYYTNEELQKYLLPVTDIEREIYDSIKNKNERYRYIKSIANLKEGTEAIGYSDKKIEITDHLLYPLEYERLTPLAYTYDEVVKLNKVTQGKFKLCKVEGINTAVIGIPTDIENEMRRVSLPGESLDDYHNVEVIENPEDKKYIVYPFEKYDGIDECINEIKKDRKIKELATRKQHI